MVYENIISEFKEFFEVQNIKEETITINLKIYKNIDDFSYMFCGCDSLLSFNKPKIIDLTNNNISSELFDEMNKENTNWNSDDKDLINELDKIPITLLSSKNHTFNSNNTTINEKFFKGNSLSFLITDKVKNINSIFKGCKSLTSIPNLSNWNTSNIINMKSLFEDCTALESLSGIENWNTSKVNNMSSMFLNCNSLKSLPEKLNWDTSNITDMSKLFKKCNSLKTLPDISSKENNIWNTNNVKNMAGIFRGCISIISLPDISKMEYFSSY